MIRLSTGLGVYWTSLHRAQIGIDPRIAQCLINLTKNELRFTEALIKSHTAEEILLLAAEFEIEIARAKIILQLLTRLQLLEPAELSTLEAQLRHEYRANWRIYGRLPKTRENIAVSIPHLDWLGTEIALALASAGVHQLKSSDSTLVGNNSHPTLRQQFFGIRKNHALASYLRANISQTLSPFASLAKNLTGSEFAAKQQQASKLVILTAQNDIDPLEINDYLSRGSAVLIAIARELDLVVGPLCLPDFGPCGMCLEHHQVDLNPHWATLAPQARAIHNLPLPLASTKLAASLLLRAALEFIDSLPCELPETKTSESKQYKNIHQHNMQLSPGEIADLPAQHETQYQLSAALCDTQIRPLTQIYLDSSMQHRKIKNQAEAKSFQLISRAWIVPPNPEIPFLISIPQHANCLCALKISHDEQNPPNSPQQK